ncbi:hypothetical protein AKJ09_07690 [Labilithrix luteola]|uniref:Lipoprotein n=1 Tax=Labilithrix luteola TaxID=1391654 RepID=A0A0K1Q5T8_9BACT|nr:hypothetical protein [Labilithrix luteola]AKV01027.1 hypothetical protein AKJ09_07690 [Labilithrix luteola]
MKFVAFGAAGRARETALLVCLAAACASTSLGCGKRKPPPASSTVISSAALEDPREHGFEGEVDVVVERPLAAPVTGHFVVKGNRARADILTVSHAVYDLAARRARYFDDARYTYFDGPLPDELASPSGASPLVSAGREETHAGIGCDVWRSVAPRGPSLEICLPKAVPAPRAFSCAAALPLLETGVLVPSCRSDVSGAGESKFSVTRIVPRPVPNEVFATPRGYREKSRVRRDVVE